MNAIKEQPTSRRPSRVVIAAAVGVFLLSSGMCSSWVSAQEPLDLPRQVRPIKPTDARNRQRISAPTTLRLGSVLPSDEELRRVEISQELIDLVTQMGDVSWLRREEATARLNELAAADEVLLAILLRTKLDTEQRARVLELVARRITEAPRGAVGIRMRRVIGQEAGVIIEAVLEGLPAREFLKVGDRIVGIDGYTIVSSEDLTAIVQSKVPGEEIEVDVIRSVVDERGAIVLDDNGRPRQAEVSIQFPLGSVDQLTQSGGVSSSTRVQAARIRLVQLVHARFADRPLRIRTPMVVKEDESYADRLPDMHASVIWLRRRLELEEIGLAEFDIDARREATQRLTELMVDAQDMDRSPAEREWLERVLQLYIELVPTD